MMKKNKDKHTAPAVKPDDVNIDNKTEDASVGDGQQVCDPIASEIETLRTDYGKLDDQLRRISADYANYQKRVPRQIEESVAYKVESFIKSLLPGIDNFDHALANSGNADVESMIKGLQMVYDNFLAILKSHGLEQIDAAGCEFDPACHQAVMNRADKDKKEGVVLDQFQKGYKLNGRTLRPAMVVVNKVPQETENVEPAQDEQQEEMEQ